MASKHVDFVVVGIWVVCCCVVLETQAQNTDLLFDGSQANPLQIAGSIYTDAETSPNIDSVKSWGSYLYVTCRYVNGDQKLEIWNVRDPKNPVMTDSLDYGNLETDPLNHWKFPYVNVFDDVIVVRSNFRDYEYYHNPTGEFIRGGQYDFAATVGEILNEEESLIMSSAASYGTYFGRLFDPYDVVPEEEYGYVILNFTNPQKPFISSLIPPVDKEEIMQSFSGHLDGELNNNPASISVLNNIVNISSRKVKSDKFLDIFWEPYLLQIFNYEVLNRSIRSQIEQIIQQPALGERFADTVDRFFEDLELEISTTIEEAILLKYEQNIQLQQILDEYHINRNDSVIVAIQKIVDHHLRMELEKELSVALLAPALHTWTDDLFQIPETTTKNEMHQTIAALFNQGISKNSVARYILDKYVRPYADIPDWMTWSMQQLVDAVVTSDGGAAVSGAIGLAHDVVTFGDFLEDLLDLIPDRYVPDEFPEDCREFLEMALFEEGVGLNRGGLAFLEMLKLYQYFNGNPNYLKYEEELSQSVMQLQDEYAGALVDTIEPFMSSLSLAGTLQERMNSFSAEISVRSAITLAVSDAILDRLQAAGIDVEASVNEVLFDHQLYLDINFELDIRQEDLASVGDFLRVLQTDIQEAQTQIHQLWDEGKSHLEYMENAGRLALTRTLREAWGEIDLDQSMHSALREYLGNHIDSRWTFGFHMDELFEKFVNSCMTDYPGFIDLISAENRIDTIAKWQYAFQLGAAAAASSLNLPMAAVCESLAITMEETYQQAMKFTMRMLLQEFASILANEMYGSFSDWSTATEAVHYSFDVGNLTSLDSVRNEAFVWENRVGIVAREEWDYLHPRRMNMILFDPASVDETKQEIRLGDWGTVDYVHAHEGIMVIGGSYYEDVKKPEPRTVALIMALDDERIIQHKIFDYKLASSFGLTSANHGSHIVLYGSGGIFLLPHPSIGFTTKENDTIVNEWAVY